MPAPCTVIDDFLPEETWSELWTQFQFMELLPISRGAGAWKLDDGVPLGSEEATLGLNQVAGSGPLAALMASVIETAGSVEVPVTGAWDRLAGRAYVYSRGTGLSWHVDDSELYAGAFIYYAHPHWNAHWGGELMLGEASVELPIMGYRFANEEYSELLLEEGRGSYIAPKPNRLVLLADAPHQVCPVRESAGDQVRASVSGFFMRPEAPGV